MTIEVEAGGRRRNVGLRRLEGGWMIATGGGEAFVNSAGISGRWSLLVGPANASIRATEIVGFKSYEVVIESRNSGELLVTVNGHAVVTHLVSPNGTRSRRPRHGGSAGPDGPRRILAPMPGRIVKVLVKPGETVVARQGLVVVEAMKMENELRAPIDGTVRAVRVTEGAAVEANTVLVEIE